MCRGVRAPLLALALCVAGAVAVATDDVSEKLKLLEDELKLAKLRSSMGSSTCSSDGDCGQGLSCFNGRCSKRGKVSVKVKPQSAGDDDESGGDDDGGSGGSSSGGAGVPITLGALSSNALLKSSAKCDADHRVCTYDRECNGVKCPGCSCNKCGTCVCAAPWSGSFCERKKQPAAQVHKQACDPRAKVDCSHDGDCNGDNCEDCKCGACGKCSCNADWTGRHCEAHTRIFYRNAREAKGLASCSEDGDCNPECDDCTCLVTGVCACSLNFHGQFCGQKRRAKRPIPLWRRQCQVRQDCNWPTCADCKCGKHFKCECGRGFNGPNCGAGGAGGKSSATPVPTPKPAPTPAPGPHTTPWPTPIFSCRAAGDCNFPLCATCDCFHGGCKCKEGWSGPFCSSRIHVPTPTPTPAPTPWHQRVAPAGEMQCDYDVDCLLAPGSRCINGGCKCPPGTKGKFCARKRGAHTTAAPKPTPQPTVPPTPFVLKAGGKEPCFAPGDCNWQKGGRCVHHYCICPPGWSGDFCDQPPGWKAPSPAPVVSKGNGASMMATATATTPPPYRGPPTKAPTPHPTPELGCHEDGDCNLAQCPKCKCKWGGCRCEPPWMGQFCEERIVPKAEAKKLTMADVLKQVAALQADMVKDLRMKTPAPTPSLNQMDAARAETEFDQLFHEDGASPTPPPSPPAQFHPHPHVGRYNRGHVRGAAWHKQHVEIERAERQEKREGTAQDAQSQFDQLFKHGVR